jgi:hypothetical protein
MRFLAILAVPILLLLSCGPGDAAPSTVSPLGIGLDLSADVLARSGGAAERTMAQRAADRFNVRDFGAVGDGVSRTIGTTYGTTLAALAAYTTANGATPFAWATNPTYGLTFTLTTSAAQSAAGTTLTFLTSLATLSGTVSVASWIAPANGPDLMLTDLQVSGSCIAAGTTVSSIPTTVQTLSAGGTTADTLTVPTGSIVLSQASSAACPAGTVVTFALSSAQVQALSPDWLGMQAAVAAAAAGKGGTAWIPAGVYYKNRPVVVPTFTDPNYVEQVDIAGDGVWNTQIYDTVDTGSFSCSIGEMSRGPGSTGHFRVHELRLLGPGAPNTVGNAVAGMDGICMGAKSQADIVSAQAYHAGINAMEDHGTITDSDVNNNFYGIWWAPNGDTVGNWFMRNVRGVGNAWAAFGVTWNNSLDSSHWYEDGVGNEPYGFYRELPPPGQTMSLDFIGNAVLESDFGESLGNGYIYDEDTTSSIFSTVFIGISPSVNGGPTFQIPGRGFNASIYVAGGIMFSTFTNCDFTIGGTAPASGFIQAGTNIQGNQFNQITYALLNTSTPLLVAPTAIFNFFAMDRAQGEFRRAEAALMTGEIVAHGANPVSNQGARPMASGDLVLGVVVQGQPSGGVVPVATRGLATVNKTTDVAIGSGVPMCVSATTPTAATACSNASGQPQIGADEDGGAAASAATAYMYVQISR